MTELATPLTVNIFTDPAANCLCVTDHNPNVIVFIKHHVVPLYLGGADVPENLVIICPTAHYSVHNLIFAYEKYNGTVPYEVTRKFGLYIRNLASIGYHGAVG